MDLKKYTYNRGNNSTMDQEFEQGMLRGKIRLGMHYIFWKKAFRWYVVEAERVERAYRRVEEVNAGMCCAKASFDIQKLVLKLKDGSELILLIGEGNEKEAVELYKEVQERYPGWLYGKYKSTDGCLN